MKPIETHLYQAIISHKHGNDLIQKFSHRDFQAALYDWARNNWALLNENEFKNVDQYSSAEAIDIFFDVNNQEEHFIDYLNDVNLNIVDLAPILKSIFQDIWDNTIHALQEPLENGDDISYLENILSILKRYLPYAEIYDYCPNCGANVLYENGQKEVICCSCSMALEIDSDGEVVIKGENKDE